LAYLNKIYPLKYKEVYLYKPLFQSEGIVVMAPNVDESMIENCIKCQISDVDAEFLTLEFEDGENEISVHFERLIYLHEINKKLFQI